MRLLSSFLVASSLLLAPLWLIAESGTAEAKCELAKTHPIAQDRLVPVNEFLAEEMAQFSVVSATIAAGEETEQGILTSLEMDLRGLGPFADYREAKLSLRLNCESSLNASANLHYPAPKDYVLHDGDDMIQKIQSQLNAGDEYHMDLKIVAKGDTYTNNASVQSKKDGTPVREIHLNTQLNFKTNHHKLNGGMSLDTNQEVVTIARDSLTRIFKDLAEGRTPSEADAEGIKGLVNLFMEKYTEFGAAIQG